MSIILQTAVETAFRLSSYVGETYQSIASEPVVTDWLVEDRSREERLYRFVFFQTITEYRSLAERRHTAEGEARGVGELLLLMGAEAVSVIRQPTNATRPRLDQTEADWLANSLATGLELWTAMFRQAQGPKYGGYPHLAEWFQQADRPADVPLHVARAMEKTMITRAEALAETVLPSLH